MEKEITTVKAIFRVIEVQGKVPSSLPDSDYLVNLHGEVVLKEKVIGKININLGLTEKEYSLVVPGLEFEIEYNPILPTKH